MDIHPIAFLQKSASLGDLTIHRDHADIVRSSSEGFSQKFPHGRS